MYFKNWYVGLLIVLLTSTNCSQAKHLYTEREYQTYWCKAKGGQMEYRLRTGERVDCVLPDYAVEFDFAKKWNECVGQALSYAAVLKKEPMCVLILENKQKEQKYKKRMDRRIINYYSVKYPNYVFKSAEITKEGLERYYKKNNPELIKQLP